MIIKNIATYLEDLKQKDIKPEIFTVWPFPEGLTVLEILNSIGYKLAHLWDSVKINTTTETTDDKTAEVSVSGDVDQLNFDFKIPRGKDGAPGPKGEPGVTVKTGTTTTIAPGNPANVENVGTDSDAILDFYIPQGAKGDKGEQGETGPAGPAGANGAPGEAGPQGEPGPKGEPGEQGPAGEPGPENLVMITATASTTTQGDYTPDTTFTDALADIQANKVVCIKLESLPGRFYIPYSSSNSEILASAGTVSGSNQSIELYTIRWAADTNTISITGTKEGCIADGGQAGQVLAKKSGESFDTEWTNGFKTLYIKNNQLVDTFNNVITFNDIYNSNYLYIIYSNGVIYNPIASSSDEIFFNAIDNSGNNITFNNISITKENTILKRSGKNLSLPNGGNAGQILSKKTAADGECIWINLPARATSEGGNTVQFVRIWGDGGLHTDNFASQNVNLALPSNFTEPVSCITIFYFDSNYTAMRSIQARAMMDSTAAQLSYRMTTDKGYRDISIKSLNDPVKFTAGFNTETNATDNSLCIPFEIWCSFQ